MFRGLPKFCVLCSKPSHRSDIFLLLYVSITDAKVQPLWLSSAATRAWSRAPPRQCPSRALVAFFLASVRFYARACSTPRSVFLCLAAMAAQLVDSKVLGCSAHVYLAIVQPVLVLECDQALFRPVHPKCASASSSASMSCCSSSPTPRWSF
jgi:hypothetical protein